MVRALEHLIPGERTEAWRTILYGGVKKPPYENMSFISFYTGGPMRATQKHTFIIPSIYANGPVFNEFNTNPDMWRDIAVAEFSEFWDPYNECTWDKSPSYVYKFPDGVNVKFGYSRTQPRDFPDYELWYVQRWPRGSRLDAVLIDRNCVTPDYMKKMGSNWDKWVRISWCHVLTDMDHVNDSVWTLDMNPLPPKI